MQVLAARYPDHLDDILVGDGAALASTAVIAQAAPARVSCAETSDDRPREVDACLVSGHI
ncbi:hypothetical protein CJ179_37480 [Rhodococcus sp. ACS1]|uniref:hypothetical protein n=1 Tax=Rhodococcus sp. ACS1 TaxID=2028570 RepID=UPI000BB1092A|nr:hypothetical protein [Rhodococcus sp. ACS1]PBC39093.1 hypothetical protein CJ179_37480 [Rhodococcus sp. ACS1]